MALAVVVLAKDPSAPEPILRHLGPEDSYFQGLAVGKNYRGLGLGRKLLDESLELARTDGKQRMFTTIHPNNLPSLRSFLGAHFLGVALQDIYYPLPNRDGMRFVMLNGDLNNSQKWAQEAVGRFASLHSVPESSLAGHDTSVAPGFATLANLLETGYCVSHVERQPPGNLIYTARPFNESLSIVPNLLFPYTTLTEGLRAHIENLKNPKIWEFVATIILKRMDADNNGELVKSRVHPDYFQPQTAQIKWLFIDWLQNYHQNLRNNRDFSPPQATGKLDRREYLDQLEAQFLLQENNALWTWVESLPAHAARPAVGQIHPKPHPQELHALSEVEQIRLLGRQNTALYGILAEKPLIVRTREADARSSMRRMARFILGKS